MKSLIAAFFAFGAFTILTTGNAQAATLTVETLDECGSNCTIDGDGLCSFGEAIFTINQGSDTKDCQNSSTDTYGNNDTIHLIANATFEFTIPDHSIPVGPTALPIIRKSVTIKGHGATLVRETGPEIQPLRFFEIATEIRSNVQIQVAWDETTFEGGNPDCECPQIVDIKSEFSGNRALCSNSSGECYSGGAGYIRGNAITATFDKTTFKNNAVRTDKAYSNFLDEAILGGAVFIDSGNFGVVNFSRSLFLNNKAPAGGAIYAGKGTQLSVTESTFTGNQAQVARDTSNDDDLDPDPAFDTLDTSDSKMGGAIYAEGPVVSVNNSAFYLNQGGVGGALALRGDTASILNSTFFKNSAELLGGAVATAPTPFNYRDFHGPSIPNSGSGSNFSDFAFASLIQSPTVTLEHVTMVDNKVGEGSAEVATISAGGGIANLGVGSVVLRHSIISENTAVGGASGANCYGNFVSLGQNNLHWPTVDPSCVITMAPGAEADYQEDPGLQDCQEDLTTPGKASCDPEPTSLMIDAAIACPNEDQHHTDRDTALCTVGAIEYLKSCDDGIAHEGEDCPDPTETQGSICGNAQVEEGEQCDDGEANNSNEPNATCRTDCRVQRCGDGIVDNDLGEVCDGGVTCFECEAVVVPAEGCGISEEDLLDPTLETNGDLISRFGLDAVQKCLHVFGGGNCSLNRTESDTQNRGLIALVLLPALIWPFVRRLVLSSRT